MPMVRSPPLSGPLVCVLGVSKPDDNWRPDLPCLGGALIMDGIAPRDPFLRSPSTFCAGGFLCRRGVLCKAPRGGGESAAPRGERPWHSINPRR